MARYYIDKTGVDNASRNGLSVAAAWASLSYACTRVAASAGHVIQVNTGTYIETTVSSLPVGVSIEGENRYSSIIKSTITSTYTISLTSSGSNTNGNQHISNLRIESNTAYASYAAIGVIKRGNVEIYNCDIRNFNYYAIALHNGEQTGSYAVGNKVHDCTINNSGGYIGVYGSGGDAKGALDILSQDGLLVYNNTIVLARPDGKNGNCIDGVEGFIKNMKVYNNTLTKTFVYGVTAWDFCIEIWNWEGGNEIYNNVITGSIDVQYGSKGSSTYSVWIHDNVIGQPTLLPKQGVRGVLLEVWNSDVIIERNHFHDICQGIYMRGHTDAAYLESNIYIRYNLFTNIGAASGGSAPSPSGWGFYCSQTAGYDDIVNNFNFYNNVVIASTAANALATCWGCGIPDHGVATGVNISNNIIMNFDTAPIVGQGWNQGTRADQVQIFNNIFYGNGYNNDVRYLTGFTVTNLTGTLTNLKTAPPFVSSTDYHLTAARVGKFITTGLLDKDNNPVANPPTIGAYEFGAVVPPIIPVTSIAVTGAGGATTINVDNGTLQLSAAVLPANATTQTVTWSITNGTGQATISAGGLVTAVANGTVTARATATDGSAVSGTLVITLSNQIVPVASITVTGAGGASIITTDDGTLQLSASVLPVNATNKVVTWSVVNGSGQATISATGLVTAISNGTVTARATATDGSGIIGSLAIIISNQVTPVSSITVTGAGGATTITTFGGTLQLSASVLPSNATNKVVTWSITNDTGQATINATGLVTAVSNGTVRARATATDGSGVSGTLLITISNQIALVTSITITGQDGATLISTKGGTLQLSAAVLPQYANNKVVVWTLTNGTGEATISSSGLVTAISDGTVTVTATATDGSGIFGILVITIVGQVIPVTAIVVSAEGGVVVIDVDNGTLQMIATIIPSDATNQEIVWSVVNGTGQATIDSAGLLTAIADGVVTVKATSSG